MANIKDADIYKQKIAEMLLSDDIVVKLLTGEDSPVVPAKDLMYDVVYPYDWMDNTSLTAGAYVCVDVDIPSVSTKNVKNCTITIWVMCHQNAMCLRGTNMYNLSYVGGTRRDKLCDRIDYLLNGCTNIGLGQVELIRANRFDPGGMYYGRELVYHVQEFNRPYEKL